MSTEATFKRAIRRKLPKHLYIWGINARFAAGIPDIWISGPGNDLWIEIKYLKPEYLKTAPIWVPVKLTDLQRKWLIDRKKEHRNVAVIIGCGQKAWILTTPDQLVCAKIKRADLQEYTIAETATWIVSVVEQSQTYNDSELKNTKHGQH